jgi:hypothetical protein
MGAVRRRRFCQFCARFHVFAGLHTGVALSPEHLTTHNKRLQRGLVVSEKYLRVANYCTNMNKEIDMIAHACGCHHARELKREHVRIVQSANQSIALNMLYPYPEPGIRGSAGSKARGAEGMAA